MAEETRQAETEAPRIDRRRELVRIRGQQKRRRIAFAIIGVFLLAILGILIAGYVIIFVMPPRQLAVRVDDVEYTRGDMVKLLRVRQKAAELTGSTFNTSVDVFQALQLIIENEMIAKEAPKYGITVTDAEVDAEIRYLLAPTQRQSQGKTPDQIEREFQENYRTYLNTVQLSREEHRQLIRKSLLREKFRQFIGESVPAVTEQVRLHRLVVAPEDEIDILQTKFRDYVGFSQDSEVYRQAFFNIVREFSRDDPEMVRRGGEIGWLPRGIFQDYDHIVFRLEPGKLSDPTSNIDKPRELFIFMVSEKSQARELSPINRDILKTRALQDWLNQQRENHDVYAVMNSDVYNWVVEQLGLSASSTPTPQPNPLQQILGNRG